MKLQLLAAAAVCGGLLIAAQVAAQQQKSLQVIQHAKQASLASEIIGITVKIQGQEQFGVVKDLVVDADGQVLYLAVAAEGTPRPNARRNEANLDDADTKPLDRRTVQAGGQLILVPWQVAKFQELEAPGQAFVIIEMEKAKLVSAPSFTVQQLRSQAGQPTWMIQVDRFFNVERRGVARPEFRDNDNRPENRKQPQEREQP